jgi:hypothetical protein
MLPHRDQRDEERHRVVHLHAHALCSPEHRHLDQRHPHNTFALSEMKSIDLLCQGLEQRPDVRVSYD